MRRAHMKPMRMALHCLCAVTNDEGDFLDDPEKPVRDVRLPPVREDLIGRPPPDVIFGPAWVPQVRRLSWMGDLGVRVIRGLGVDRMPVWFPILLGSDVAFALLIFAFLR